MKRSEALNWLTPDDLLNITTDAIIVVDKDRNILLFNESAERMFGYPAEEVIGQLFDILVSAAQLRMIRKHLLDLEAERNSQWQGPERMEVSVKRKNGSEFPAEVVISRFKRSQKELFTVSLRDITPIKRIEEDRTKWSEAFKHAEWGVVIGRAEATHLETMNPAFARLYGYHLEELTGKPILDIYVAEEREKALFYLQRAHETGHVTFESRHLRKDGTIFPVLVDITAVKDANGKVLYRVVNVLDITERKQAEQALLESEARAASIITSLEEGITLQERSGSILTCNASAERILGLTADQLMGRTSVDPRWNAIHEDGSPFPGENHPAMVALRIGQPCRNVVMGVNKPDGTRTWISINTQPLFHTNDSLPYAVVSSFSDITERVQTYHLLEQRVQERTRELSALLQVSRDVASTLELKPLLILILKHLRNVVEYSDAGIAILEDDYFKIVEFQGQISREKMLQFQVPFSLDSGYRRVMQTRSSVSIGDIWDDSTWLQSLQAAAGPTLLKLYENIHAWIGVPLIARDHIIGVLRLDDTTPHYFTEERARLIRAFADHVAIAIENARFHEQSQSLVVLQERQKLARELHDSVSQALYGIALGVRTARTLLERAPHQAKEPLDYSLSLANAGLAEMRALIFELRPESLELEGIVAALSKQAAAVSARYSIRVEETYCEEPQVPLIVKEAIYRIAQEALQNIIKHAHADQVELQLDRTDGLLILKIRDNGQGFVIAQSYPGHLGMKSMQERAERIGGRFRIESSPGQGTVIQVWVTIH